MSFLLGIILPYIANLLIGLLESAESKIDWAGLKAEVDAFVQRFCSGFLVFLAPELQAAADAVLAQAQAIVTGTLQATILEDLAQKNVAGALAALTAALKAAVEAALGVVI